jgi:hypothetical protein
MKTTLRSSHLLLGCAALLLTASFAEARVYGVSASSAGRGTVYHGSGGGSAYVGPRGAVAQGPNGNVAAANRYGGAVAVGPNGAAYRPPAYRPPATTLPAGYIRVVPSGYRTVYYGGYNCCFVGGIYYRPIMYQGTSVYIVVK